MCDTPRGPGGKTWTGRHAAGTERHTKHWGYKEKGLRDVQNTGAIKRRDGQKIWHKDECCIHCSRYYKNSRQTTNLCFQVMITKSRLYTLIMPDYSNSNPVQFF